MRNCTCYLLKVGRIVFVHPTYLLGNMLTFDVFNHSSRSLRSRQSELQQSNVSAIVIVRYLDSRLVVTQALSMSLAHVIKGGTSATMPFRIRL